MKQQFRYDRTRSPAAPILPVRVGVTAGGAHAVSAALVDTGAEISVIPAQLASDLRLPVIGEVTVGGVSGADRVPLYGVELEVAGIKVQVEAAGMGFHTLIGRDVINRWTLVLRGPEETLVLEAGKTRGT